MNDQIDAIDRAGRKYRAAVEAGDIDATMACWADDGVWMPAGRPSIVGKEGIRKAYQELFFDPFVVKKYAAEVEEIVPAGTWAFERARFRITVTPKAGGDEMEWIGKYIIMWQGAAAGVWKMARAINNSDLPEGHAGQK
jgi:ketosteroid isomerase-like protein